MVGFFIALLSGALMSIQGVLIQKLPRRQVCGLAMHGVQLTAFGRLSDCLADCR